jgi:SAM-dependent methyltransferase
VDVKPALTQCQVVPPESWDALPMGDWLAAEIQERLNLWCPLLFGYHLLKLGALSHHLSCRASAIRHQLTIAPSVGGILADVIDLPIRDSSIDACILAHVLDYTNDPHQVLREIERVLTADGWLILSGFNPHSLVGLGRLLPYMRRQQPWQARMFSPERIRDWLELLGFELVHYEAFGFSSFSSSSKIHWWRENLGRDYCSYFASVYMLAARKRTIPLTPEPERRWAQKPLIVPGMARI